MPFNNQISATLSSHTEFINYGCGASRAVAKFKLNYLVASLSNHSVWLPQGQNVRHNKWRKFERIFSNKETETRYIREIIFGKRRPRQYNVTSNFYLIVTWFWIKN